MSGVIPDFLNDLFLVVEGEEEHSSRSLSLFILSIYNAALEMNDIRWCIV